VELDTLISIPEAARRSGTEESTMRRRLKKLDKQLREQGRPPVLIRFGSRVWKVRAEALRIALRTNDTLRAELDAIDERLSCVESTAEHTVSHVNALRDSVVSSTKEQASRWEAQNRVNNGLSAAIAGIRDLTNR